MRAFEPSKSRLPQAGLAVTVLNVQRNASAKLADDREAILKTLQELKCGNAIVSETGLLHWQIPCVPSLFVVRERLLAV